MKVKLTYVKDTPKISAGGKNYTSRSIKTQEHGDKWLSGFANANNKGWKVGDEVEIEVKEVQKDDKTYLNFEVPKSEDKANINYEKILNEIVSVKLILHEILSHVEPKKKAYPTRASEGMTEDQPFEDDREPPIEAYDENN